MAYVTIAEYSGNQTTYNDNYAEYIIQSAADLSSLPKSASAGSTAYTEDGKHFYKKGLDGTWREW